MLKRLGSAETKEERYNNGFAHFTMAGPSAFIRAFETRQHSQVTRIELTIREAVLADPEDTTTDPKKLVGQVITRKRPLFHDSMTGTQWIENFYQESPSINARARDDQVQIGIEAFKQPAFSPFMAAAGETQSAPESD
jgi:hypothetical protein